MRASRIISYRQVRGIDDIAASVSLSPSEGERVRVRGYLAGRNVALDNDREAWGGRARPAPPPRRAAGAGARGPAQEETEQDNTH